MVGREGHEAFKVQQQGTVKSYDHKGGRTAECPLDTTNGLT